MYARTANIVLVALIAALFITIIRLWGAALVLISLALIIAIVVITIFKIEAEKEEANDRR